MKKIDSFCQVDPQFLSFDNSKHRRRTVLKHSLTRNYDSPNYSYFNATTEKLSSIPRKPSNDKLQTRNAFIKPFTPTLKKRIRLNSKLNPRKNSPRAEVLSPFKTTKKGNSIVLYKQKPQPELFKPRINSKAAYIRFLNSKLQLAS